MADKKKDIVLENCKGFMRLGASSCAKETIPTGHFKLDFIINNGEPPDGLDLSSLDGYDPSKMLGLPCGKIIEIFGEEGGGKSSLAHRVVGYAQKMGYKCAWIDTEFSYSESLAELNGVNIDEVYYSDMSNAENAETVYNAEDVFDAIVELCKSGVKVIVLDSVANLVPKARMEKNAEQATVGIIAKLMSENLGKIGNFAAKYGVLILFINQLREKIGILWGSPETSPGGRSLKHNASLRLQVSKMNSKEAEIVIETENGSRVIGRKSRVNIRKNRFAKPFLDSLEIPIYYESYFPEIEELMFDSGRQLKIISVRTNVFKWEDLAVEGRKAFIEAIKEQKLQSKLYFAISEAAKEQKVFLPPELGQWAEENYNSEEINKNEVTGVENAEQTDEGKVKRGRKAKNSDDGKSNSD